MAAARHLSGGISQGVGKARCEQFGDAMASYFKVGAEQIAVSWWKSDQIQIAAHFVARYYPALKDAVPGVERRDDGSSRNASWNWFVPVQIRWRGRFLIEILDRSNITAVSISIVTLLV